MKVFGLSVPMAPTKRRLEKIFTSYKELELPGKFTGPKED